MFMNGSKAYFSMSKQGAELLLHVVGRLILLRRTDDTAVF